MANELKEIKNMLAAHINQYDEDMRGDTKPDSGNIGIVGTLREQAEYHKRYPPLTWLLLHRTKVTLTIIVLAISFIYFVLQIVTPEEVTAFLAGKIW